MSPAHVLAVYAEPLVANRRVALLGPEDPSLIEALLALGARLLYVYDPRPNVDTPHRGSDPRVTIAPLRAGDVGVREGAFDLALIPDLMMLGDPESALAYVKRLVGASGVALIGCRNREAETVWARAPEGAPAPSYTEFYDLCAIRFAEVRMAGVAPFAAYAVAEFAPDREPSITFDASLVAAPDPPEWFVAVASQSDVSALEAYEIVQIPRDAINEAEATTDPGEYDALRAQLSAADLKRQEAEARAGEEVLRAERIGSELRAKDDELRKLRDKAGKQTKELEDEKRGRQRAEGELRSPEFSQLRERVLALEAELIEARTQLATPRAAPVDPRLQQERDQLAAEAATLRSAVQQSKGHTEELRQRLVERDRELQASLARAQQLEDRLAEQLADTSRRDEERGDLETRRNEQRGEIDKAIAVAQRLRDELALLQSTHEHDVASLEAALRTAGEELRAARLELIRRERMVRELVARVEDNTGLIVAPVTLIEPPPELLRELDLARRELKALVEEVRRRDGLVSETRSALEHARRDLESERSKTEQLARDAARREAALQTAAWRISELERLGTDGSDAPAVTRGDASDKKLDSELDALRRALTSEHGRVEALERELAAAGSGGDPGLRARVREQEALIAQLSAELAARVSQS